MAALGGENFVQCRRICQNLFKVVPIMSRVLYIAAGNFHLWLGLFQLWLGFCTLPQENSNCV